MSLENILVRIRMHGAESTKHDADKVARSFDNMGDQARQAGRKMQEMNASSGSTRVNVGAFSTSLRFGTIGLGMFINNLAPATSAILGFAEGVGTAAIGGGAAAGVGLLAFGQASAVAALGAKDFTDALGGNAEAMKRLGPQARMLVATLGTYKQQLHDTVDQGLFPGLAAGSTAALKNFPIIQRLMGDTSRSLGGLANRAGNMLGSKSWGADIATVGGANVKIIGNLGDAALHAADGFRHIVVAAAPLAVWLSQRADRGITLLDRWLGDKRRTGELTRFFEKSKQDIRIIASIGGHTGRGLLNLFGSHDVDGTKTLQSIDRISARFERWSNGPAMAHGFGQALTDAIPKIGGELVAVLANSMARGAATAAGVFWHAFWDASAEGKALIGAGILWKSGAFKVLGGKLFDTVGGGSKGGGLLGGFGQRGSTPANPLYVFVVDQMPGGKIPGVPGVPGESGGSRVGNIFRKVAPAALDSPLLPIAAAGAAAVGIGTVAQMDNAGKGGSDTSIPRYGQVPPDLARKGYVGMSGLPALPIELHNHNTINLDGQPIYKNVSKHATGALARRGG